jgi:hypothetical protein
VRPLRGGNVIYFAAETGGVEAVLGVGLGHANKVGHDIRRFARALGDENVDAGGGGAGTGARRLDDHFVGGLAGHGDSGDFADLQACAEKLDTRGAERITFEERNLELALAEAEDDVNLLRFFHEQAGSGSLPDYDVDGKLAIDAVSNFENKTVRSQEAGGLGDVLAGKVGHSDLAAVDGDAHGGDGGKESCGSKDEDEEGHLA